MGKELVMSSNSPCFYPITTLRGDVVIRQNHCMKIFVAAQRYTSTPFAPMMLQIADTLSNCLNMLIDLAAYLAFSTQAI